MSKLLEKIKQDQLKYRKLHDKFATASLTTLIGELQSEEKRGTVIDDAKVISSLKKTIQGLQERQGHFLDNHVGADPIIEMEINFLDSYLPKQLTEDELTDIIKGIGATNMGQIMGYLKQNHAGLYDGKTASQIAKSVLQ